MPGPKHHIILSLTLTLTDNFGDVARGREITEEVFILMLTAKMELSVTCQ